jgi:hypothetical protein
VTATAAFDCCLIVTAGRHATAGRHIIAGRDTTAGRDTIAGGWSLLALLTLCRRSLVGGCHRLGAPALATRRRLFAFPVVVFVHDAPIVVPGAEPSGNP